MLNRWNFLKPGFYEGIKFADGQCFFAFDGLVDEVGLFNRALTDDEIMAIYDAGSAGMIKP